MLRKRICGWAGFSAAPVIFLGLSYFHFVEMCANKIFQDPRVINFILVDVFGLPPGRTDSILRKVIKNGSKVGSKILGQCGREEKISIDP